MKNWFLWMLAGIFCVVAGFFALTNVFAASIAAERIISYTFIIASILLFIAAIRDKNMKARYLVMIFSVLIFLLGINLLMHPLRGLVSITMVAAIMLLVSGVVRIMYAFRGEFKEVRMVMIFSGIISVLLAMMIFSNFPYSAVVYLGIYLGIELLSNGVYMIFASLNLRKLKSETVSA